MIGVNGLGLDLANDEIFVVDSSSAILVFPRTGSGNIAPSRSIAGALTTISNDQGDVIIDDSTSQVFMTDYTNNTILSVPRTANGNVAPATSISGNATGLTAPWGLSLCQ